MHGTGMWLGAFIPLLAGGDVVTLTEPHRSTRDELLGARPDANGPPSSRSSATPSPSRSSRRIDEAKPAGAPYDTSSLKMIISSGVMWTAEVKEQMLDRIEQVVLRRRDGLDRGLDGHRRSR